MRRTTVATIGAIAAVGAFGVGAGTASAAPAERPLSVEQVPNAGVTVGANGITGGFVASILASATEPGVTLITLNTTPTESCATNLKDARVGITWKNTSTGASGLPSARGAVAVCGTVGVWAKAAPENRHEAARTAARRVRFRGIG